jgi:translation initiation factor IF-3
VSGYISRSLGLSLREKDNNNNNSNLPLVNDQIRFPRVQVIAADGQNVGVISRIDALRMAHEADLDLVLIADKGAEGFPVVKVMDFGKALYAKKKKQAESKKHQKVIQIKEIKMSPKIGEHDYQTKLNQAIQFLKDGKRLKMTLTFRGREIAVMQERGNQMFEKIDKTFGDAGLHVGQEKELRTGSLWTRMYFLKK